MEWIGTGLTRGQDMIKMILQLKIIIQDGNVMRHISLLFITILFCGCMSCEIPCDSIKFVNNSDDSITIYIATGFYEYAPTAYPDTLLPYDRMLNWSTPKKLSQTLAPEPPTAGAKKGYACLPLDLLFDNYLPLDTLSVMIIKLSDWRNTPWQELREKNMVLVRYDYSRADLERCGNTIYYPPAPWMKDMKMWPPYSTFTNDTTQTTAKK